MTRRTQVQSQLQPVGLRPAASPVSTFTDQTTGARKSQQLAAALGQFAPSVQRYGVQYQQREAAEMEAAGEAEARRLSLEGRTLAQLTREGKMPKQDNPWFVNGLREQFGRVEADNWMSDFRHMMLNDEALKHAGDMETFDKAARAHSQAYLKEKAGNVVDPAFERGYGGRFDAYYTQLRSEFASRVDKNLTKQADDAEFSEAHRHVMENFGKASFQDIGKGLEVIAKRGMARGRTQGEVNRVLTKVIAAAAIEADDYNFEVLKLMDNVSDGQGGHLSDQAFGLAAKEKAMDDIVNTVWQRQSRQEQILERNRKKTVRDIMSTAIDTVVAGERLDLKKLAPLLKDSPEALAQLQQLQSQATDLNNASNEGIKRSIFERIWARQPGQPEVTHESIIAEVNMKNLSVPDAQNLIAQLKSAEDAENGTGPAAGIWKDFQFRTQLETISPTRFSDLLVKSGEAVDRAAAAKAMFSSAWYKLHESGQAAKMNPDQISQWLLDNNTKVVEQQRGPNAIRLAPAPLPTFASNEEIRKKMPPSLLVSEQELADVRTSGTISPNALRIMNSYGFTTGPAIREFFLSQSELFQKANGRAPKSATPAEKPTEESLADKAKALLNPPSPKKE